MDGYLLLILKNIEEEFKENPDKIWEYLTENELLLTKSAKKNNFYIICVDEYVKDKNAIHIKFIYSIKNDIFYNESGFEYPDKIWGVPHSKHIYRLTTNFDYLMYLAKDDEAE